MGIEEQYGDDVPFVGLSVSKPHHSTIVKTGTVWTAMAHILTAMIGAGVLSLAWSIAQLGWVAGPLAVLVFSAITIFSTFLLCDCYRSPDPEVGHIVNRSYLAAVQHFLGRKSGVLCSVLVKESLFGSGVAYTITAAVSMRAIQKSTCLQREGHQASCTSGSDMYILWFGCVQVIMSQIPDLHNMKWLSVLATLMSFIYASIGLGLGSTKAIENREIKGSLGGVPASSSFQKMSLVFQAMGDIAYSFPYSIIVFEIQDTLKSYPYENRIMKKASFASVLISTFFFLFCACFAYAAFGDETPGNILSGFESFQPSWIINLAHACIVVHLIGGYQVFSQPAFACYEEWISKKFPDNQLANDIYTVKLPLLPVIRVNLLRLCFRTTYVALTTLTAMFFPYFNQVLGVIGSLNFWPLAIYFPIEMYLVQNKADARGKTTILLRAFSACCLLVCFLALTGSIEGIVSAKAGNTS